MWMDVVKENEKIEKRCNKMILNMKGNWNTLNKNEKERTNSSVDVPSLVHFIPVFFRSSHHRSFLLLFGVVACESPVLAATTRARHTTKSGTMMCKIKAKETKCKRAHKRLLRTMRMTYRQKRYTCECNNVPSKLLFV